MSLNVIWVAPVEGAPIIGHCRILSIAYFNCCSGFIHVGDGGCFPVLAPILPYPNYIASHLRYVIQFMFRYEVL